ncbi:MAG: thioredoxin family protein [Clostridiaceae bacterium]|nr:thioredoxin family protein [Clostridiaceae bacterium]
MEKLSTKEEIHHFIKENKLAMLYFSSDACSVCGELLPKIKKVLGSYTEIKCKKIEVDKNMELMGPFNAFTLPCILMYIEEKEMIREARFISIGQLEAKIKRYYTMLDF